MRRKYFEELALFIKELRDRKKLKDESFAFRSKLHVNTINLIERKQTIPTLPTLLMMVAALDMNMDDFFRELNERFLKKYPTINLKDPMLWYEPPKKLQ
jgi:transcriptional regulator with XRE-family HTH domain